VSEPRHFNATVNLIDIDEPAFSALVEIGESAIVIESLGAEIGRWRLTEIEVAHCDEGVLVEVPGTLMVVRTDDDQGLIDAVVARSSPGAVAGVPVT
jgi:hypothetical protein